MFEYYVYSSVKKFHNTIKIECIIVRVDLSVDERISNNKFDY